jgi:uncharacterized caspase-like protein
MTKRFGLTLFLAFAALGGFAHAQGITIGAAQPESEPRTALVIGNAAYKDAPLVNPVNDAEDVAKRLSDLGFRVMLHLNANQRQMKQAIRSFSTTLKSGGVALFFFAGHGVQSRNRNYLLPVNADVQNEYELEDEAVDANLVIGAMDEAQTRVNIVILDACRNNPFAKSFRSASQGLAQMEAARGSLVAFATSPGSVAADGLGRNGTYSKHLLVSLATPDVEVERVFKRVAQGVSTETRGRQIPWTSSSLTGDFYFVEPGAAPAAPKADAKPVPVIGNNSIQLQVELAFWDTIKTSTMAEDFDEYLGRFPDGQFVGLARNRLKALRAKK